jgi:hypothetical protein
MRRVKESLSTFLRSAGVALTNNPRPVAEPVKSPDPIRYALRTATRFATLPARAESPLLGR